MKEGRKVILSRRNNITKGMPKWKDIVGSTIRQKCVRCLIGGEQWWGDGQGQLYIVWSPTQ